MFTLFTFVVVIHIHFNNGMCNPRTPSTYVHLSPSVRIYTQRLKRLRVDWSVCQRLESCDDCASARGGAAAGASALAVVPSRVPRFELGPESCEHLTAAGGGGSSQQHEERGYRAFPLRLIQVFRPAPAWIL